MAVEKIRSSEQSLPGQQSTGKGRHLQGRGPSHGGHLQDTGQMASVLCRGCIVVAPSLQELFGGPRTQGPWPHGQQLMAVLGGEESLGGSGPGQHWVCAITWNVLSSPQGAGTLNHMSPPLSWPSSFSQRDSGSMANSMFTGRVFSRSFVIRPSPTLLRPVSLAGWLSTLPKGFQGCG